MTEWRLQAQTNQFQIHFYTPLFTQKEKPKYGCKDTQFLVTGIYDALKKIYPANIKCN